MFIRYRLFLITALMLIAGACLITPSLLYAQDGPVTTPTELVDRSEATSAVGHSAAAGGEELSRSGAFLHKLYQGGPTMLALLLVSIFGLSFAVERFVRCQRSRFAPAGLAAKADALWKQQKHAELQALCQRDKSTLAAMIGAIVEHRDDRQEATLIATDMAARDLKRHLQRAYPLAVVATLAPLLGLLGTVIGMIGAFDKVAAAGSMGDASILGGDIAKALITTAAGLVVAVPALALYHYFKSRISVFGVTIEEQASELISRWFRKSTPRPEAIPAPAPSQQNAVPVRPAPPVEPANAKS